MRALTDFVVALADLLEAEVRFLKRSLIHVLLAGALMIGAAVLLTGGIALWIFGLFTSLQGAGLGVSAAAWISGAAALTFAAIVTGVALWLGK